MKKILHILIPLFVLSACDDELDLSPISDAGSNGFYNNVDDFTQAVNGVYNTLQFHPDRYVDLREVRSDNIYSPGQAGVRDWNAINNFQTTLATLTFISDVWNDTFNGIMRANTVLDKLAENPDAVEDAAVRTRLEAESRFLRALLYFDLVKWFGKVPLIESFVTPTEALEIERSPVDVVYNLIISDLEFASNNLPASYEAANRGRATSFAAKGVLARVYLSRSGPVLHPDGPGLGTNEYDLALSLLNDIINSSQFSLLPVYADVFDYNNESNAEIVWDFNYISGGLGVGALYPTAFYDEGWARINLGFPGGNPGDGPKRVSDDLLNSYEPNDQRLEPTVLQGYINAEGDMVDAIFFDKFINPDLAGGDRFDWPINYPFLRYADVLMMKAECMLQRAAGSQGEVDDIVNQIRMRANLDPMSNVTLEMLLEERRKEFAAESLRWDDLVRTGMVLDVMNAWIAVEDNSGQILSVTANSIIYPVPQDQLDVKQGLYQQNPGY